MSGLKSLFKTSYDAKDLKGLITAIIVYIIIGVVAGLLCWLIGIIPLIGGLLRWIVGTAAGLYVLIGIVLAVLVFLKLVK